MAIRKSAIYSQIWAACDKLRGGVEPARYKDYILTLLFVKYVTDRYKGDKWADIQVPEGGSFNDMVAAKGATSIGEKLNVIIGKLARANDLKGVIDIADFNDEDQLGKGKEMVDKLTDLVAIFEKPELNFQRNRAGGDDIIGDAYEYLMRNFAVDSGKSKGQFYTPGEVSRIMAKVIGIGKATGTDETVYDPACGSGSLLIRAADEAPLKADGSPNVAIYGQEKDNATVGLAKMNFVLHNKATGEILPGNTLADPKHKSSLSPTVLKRFSFVVSNPPFSLKAWRDGVSNPDTYDRFDGYTMPPEKNGDYAWLLHMLKSMKDDGKGAIILPRGVLFRGNAEAAIRRKIVDRGYIEGIIGLPANLFYGTGIPACVIVLNKEHAVERQGIFMIDASRDYRKDGSKNRLRERDIKKIVTAFNGRQEIPKYSRLVPNEEIKVDNEYNLNLSRYIDSSDPEDLQDISGHLLGGIPNRDIDALGEYWAAFPSLRDTLFSEVRKGYSKLKLPKEEIAAAIAKHPEFLSSASVMENAFAAWQSQTKTSLLNLSSGDTPKGIINDLSERLISDFARVPLIDQYDVYQVLMSYYEMTLQDDLFSICYDGWKGCREVSYEYAKDKQGTDTTRVRSFDGKVIPRDVIVSTFFKDEQAAINRLTGDLEALEQQRETMVEEMSGDDGLLTEVIDSQKNTIDKSKLTARIETVKGKPAFADEYEALLSYEKQMKQEAIYRKSVKEAVAALDESVIDQYANLTIKQIKALVVDRKWFYQIYNGIDALYTAVCRRLSSRVVELAERYECTLPDCEAEVECYEAKVNLHLKEMGFEW